MLGHLSNFPWFRQLAEYSPVSIQWDMSACFVQMYSSKGPWPGHWDLALVPNHVCKIRFSYLGGRNIPLSTSQTWSPFALRGSQAGSGEWLLHVPPTRLTKSLLYARFCCKMCLLEVDLSIVGHPLLHRPFQAGLPQNK